MWITFPPSLYFSSVEASVEMPFLTTLSGLATTLTLFLTPYFHCSSLNNKQLPDLSHDFHFYSLTKHCFLSFRSDLSLNKKIKSKTCAVALLRWLLILVFVGSSEMSSLRPLSLTPVYIGTKLLCHTSASFFFIIARILIQISKILSCCIV